MSLRSQSSFKTMLCLEYPNNRVLTFEAEFTEDATWEVPLKSFLDFLSAWYGYDISDSIHLESILNNNIFKHIPKNDEFSKRVREAMEDLGMTTGNETPNYSRLSS
jgi:hypothetical protein